MQMLDMRDGVPVADAAQRLGVSRSEVYRLISSGVIASREFAGRHVIPRSEVRRLEHAPRPVGRPFAPHVAWQLIGMLSGRDPSGLGASRRSQLRRHLREAEPEPFAGRLRSRAARRLRYAHPSQLQKLAGDPRLLLSGASALEHVSEVDLVAHDRSSLGAYVRQRDLRELESDYVLAKGSDVPNVLLRVVDVAEDVLASYEHAPGVLVALDLLESVDSRSADAGRRLFAQVLDEAQAQL